MISRHKMESFKKEVAPLLELVTNDIYLESIWLSNMSILEDMAAKFILSNITDATPTEALRTIIDHVKDEQKHSKLLQDMRPVTIYPDLKYYKIENEWKKIGNEFIMGFFNSPLLREANNRHAAYVHAAQTIERFPFRIYSLYLSMTKLDNIKNDLIGIIKDENDHIELGKKLYAKLENNEQMSLIRLYRLEEELCLMMLKRMNLSLRQCLNIYSPELNSDFEIKMTTDDQLEIAWNYALSCGEELFSSARSQQLKDANTIPRTILRKNPSFKALENKLTSILNQYIFKIKDAGLPVSIIQKRFDSHYKKMIYNTNNVPLHYAYFRILEDHPSKEEPTQEIELEQLFWNQLNVEISQMLT